MVKEVIMADHKAFLQGRIINLFTISLLLYSCFLIAESLFQGRVFVDINSAYSAVIFLYKIERRQVGKILKWAVLC